MTPSIPDRIRAAEEPHVRTIERQMLDALLRIEELLTKIAENTKPQATSVPSRTEVLEAQTKAVAKDGKRRNPREL